MDKGAIFPLFYLPALELFSELRRCDNALIERYEHFPKQTYRNRAMIYSPQGSHALVVPVVRGSKVHTKVKDVRISYDFDWQRLHWLSLQTSYRRSAYFEYYEDDFAPFYQKQWKFLFDYNYELFTLLVRLLKMNMPAGFTESYEVSYPEMSDYRGNIHPKREAVREFKPYFQVFEDRHGFIPGLSIVDLLFNQGPQSLSYL